MDSEVIDLSENPYLEKEVIKAEAKDRNVIILRKLDSPYQRFDGRRVSYEIEYRWLSRTPTEKGDEVCCLRGNEYSYWSSRELTKVGVFKKHSSLFKCFYLL